MRLWVRPSETENASSEFQGPSSVHQTAQRVRRSAGQAAPSPNDSIPEQPDPLTRKENSRWDRRRRVRARSRHRQPARLGEGILTFFPFGARSKRPLNCSRVRLRIDSPASKHRSRGTLLHFGLQDSRLNSCYYHQDLHQGPLHPASRPGLCGDPRALLLAPRRRRAAEHGPRA